MDLNSLNVKMFKKYYSKADEDDDTMATCSSLYLFIYLYLFSSFNLYSIIYVVFFLIL